MMQRLSRQHLSQVAKPAPGVVLSSFTLSECWKVKKGKSALFEASFWHVRENLPKVNKTPKGFHGWTFGMKFSYRWPSSCCAAYSALQMARNWNAAKLPPSLAPAMFICELSALHGIVWNTQLPSALVLCSCWLSSPVCALLEVAVSAGGNCPGICTECFVRCRLLDCSYMKSRIQRVHLETIGVNFAMASPVCTTPSACFILHIPRAGRPRPVCRSLTFIVLYQDSRFY